MEGRKKFFTFETVIYLITRGMAAVTDKSQLRAVALGLQGAKAQKEVVTR